MMPRNRITMWVLDEAEGEGFEPSIRRRRITAFETAAFDRSATPPRSPGGQTGYPLVLEVAMRNASPPEPGFARWEAKLRAAKAQRRRRGQYGGNMVSPVRVSRRRSRREPQAEKEGFEPSRQGFSPPNALAGRRLQPLGHFSTNEHRIAEPSGRYPVPRTSEGWQSGRMRRSRKPFGAVTSREGSNPSPSAS